MPILESKANQSAIPRILLAIGCGAVLGLLGCSLTESPSHLLLSFSVATTAGLMFWLLFASLVRFLHYRRSMRQRNVPHAEPEEGLSYEIPRRLAEEKFCLEHLDAEREYRGDPGFGKTTESRIVWKELLELELEDIDEQVNRICQATRDAVGSSPGTERHPRRGR